MSLMTNVGEKLAASVFGELWKLEPLPEERKSEWRREMEWLLAPTNYMVELVPAKQNDANGQTLEVCMCFSPIRERYDDCITDTDLIFCPVATCRS